MVKTVLIAAVGLVALSGCTQHIEYVPNPVSAFTPDSKAKLQSQLRYQLNRQLEDVPADVEITDEYFKTSNQEVHRIRFGLMPLGSTAIPKTHIVYFRDIGDTRLDSRRGTFTVSLIERGTERLLFRLLAQSRDDATQFIDAVGGLKAFERRTQR